MSQKKSGPTPALEAYRRRMSDPPVVRVQHKSEWQQRRAVVREKLLQALSLQPMPDRLPLELKSGGVLERETYRVEPIYWQTWPGVYAGGWLYTPVQNEGRGPAVLMTHQFSDHQGGPVAAHRLLAALAHHGYVGLAVDCHPAGYAAIGYSPLTTTTLDCLRALDFLAGHPNVDRQQIGLVAHSSSFELAHYLLALDDRIHAAALSVPGPPSDQPAPRVADYLRDVHGISRFTNSVELCAVASPRAALFLLPEDESGQLFRDRELRELRAYYHLWQQPDRLAHATLADPEIDSPEARTTLLNWLARELRGQRLSDPLVDPELPLEAPEVYKELLQDPPGYHDGDALHRWFEKRTVAQPPQLEGKPARRSYQERVGAELRDLLALPGQSCTLESTTTPQVHTRTPAHPHTVTFRSEPDVRIPALWLPGTGAQPYPVLIAVHPEGKEAAVKTELARSFHAAGYGVLAPDVRLYGELQAEGDFDPVRYLRPRAGMAVTDLHACVQWLLGEEGVDARGLVLWGDGELGVAAMLAAGLDERIVATVADCQSTTYRDGGQGLPTISGILRVADVPQIASLVAPRPLWLYQVPEERVGFSSRRYYDWTRRSFQSLGEVEALKMSTKSLPEPQALLDWLRLRLKRAKRF